MAAPRKKGVYPPKFCLAKLRRVNKKQTSRLKMRNLLKNILTYTQVDISLQPAANKPPVAKVS